MKALGQAQSALQALADLLPDEAERVAAGRPYRDGARSASFASGDVVLVRPGGRVPADGVVVDGEAEVRRVDGDRRVTAGAESRRATRLVAGTVATDSSIRVEVDAVGDDTALAGIQRLVAEAQASQESGAGSGGPLRGAAVLRRGRRWAGHVPGVDHQRRRQRSGRADRHGARHRLPARPRARHPAGYLVVERRGRAVRHPRFRNRLALERMRTIDAVLFDKTGTLTKGEHVVTGVAGATAEDEVLQLAGSGRGGQRAPAGQGHRHGREQDPSARRCCDDFRR